MFVLKIVIFSLIILSILSGMRNATYRRNLRLRQRIAEGIRNRQRNNARVCYDIVGCFEVSNPRSPFQKLPQNPDDLDTKFFLFRRNIKFSEPEILYYNDNGTSLKRSHFNFTQPLKIIIHGYLGFWNYDNILNVTHTYLEIGDYNVINIDWATAASGPQYANAAANTEVVGRQLGLMLQQMITSSLNPDNIHLIGFSLGAHVAACASELLKNNNILIGRITGLDAASPLFRTSHNKERSRKLDKSDAKFVDVLHTDGSPVVIDGFGLWEPLGHVDFFANGGQQQPGCIDRKPSIVLTHLERAFEIDRACSHLRALELFMESLMYEVEGKDACQFTSFKCPGGLSSYETGQCFPKLDNPHDPNHPLAIDPKYRNDIGLFGESARGNGVLFFATRDVKPYCGAQLQLTVRASPRTPATSGTLVMEIGYDNERTKLQTYCDLSDLITRNVEIRTLTAVKHNSLRTNLKKIQMAMHFYHYDKSDNITSIIPDNLIVEGVSLKDMYGNSWMYYGQEINMNENQEEPFGAAIVLKKNK